MSNDRDTPIFYNHEASAEEQAQRMASLTYGQRVTLDRPLTTEDQALLRELLSREDTP